MFVKPVFGEPESQVISVSITPLSAERLRVIGDVATDLAVPFEPDDDRFHLAFSDGTLVAGEYDPEDDAFLYIVEVEGTGTVRTAPDKLTLEGDIVWVTIAAYDPAHRTKAAPQSMPLFRLGEA